MMLTLAYTMHRGKVRRQQQDCILIDGAIHQVYGAALTLAVAHVRSQNSAILNVGDS